METRGEVDRSFERLYRLHRTEVYGAALRELGNVHDAEDVTQAAFVDAYRAILRGTRPESPRAWLLAIAENVRRRRFRAARRRPAEDAVAAEALPAPELPHEQAQALRTALHSLPTLQREVFLLREIGGLSYEEIATRADASVAAVQMLLHRARQTLRAELEPPSTARRARAAFWPAWLIQLAGRADRSLLTPRGAGAVGAAALVLGGSTAGLIERQSDATPQAAVPPRPVASIVRGEARAAPVAERPRPARHVTRTVAPHRPAARAAPSVAAPAPAVPVRDSAPAAAPAQTSVATPSAAQAEEAAPVSDAPAAELPPAAEVAETLPVPAVPPTDALPVAPPVELPPPVEVAPAPVELPSAPVELPPLPPVVAVPPLPAPPAIPPTPLP